MLSPLDLEKHLAFKKKLRRDITNKLWRLENITDDLLLTESEIHNTETFFFYL